MRIRTIKPDFWLHEGLATLTPLHRLLFVGLWQLADREGRLENRPLRIRAALFPYEPVEVTVLVEGLCRAGFLQVYGDHEEYLAIPGFSEHQRPHPKEPRSILPEPPSREKKRPAVFGSASIPSSPVGREGKGREGDLGREPVEPGRDPEPHPFQALWNSSSPPRAPKWTKRIKARNKTADLRTREHPEPDFWPALFRRINASDFLSGRKTGFVVSPDWVLNPTNLNKILEGTYDGNDLPKLGLDRSDGIVSNRDLPKLPRQPVIEVPPEMEIPLDL